MRVEDSPALRPASLTLEGWFNFSSLSGVRVLFGKTLGTGSSDSYVVWYNSGALRAVVQSAAGGGSALAYTWTPEIGTWYHVAYTFDDSANTNSLYVNGIKQVSGATSVSIGYDSHPLLIGAEYENENINYWFAGRIDEARLWNIARSQEQIQADMQKRLAGNEAGLAGYWRFDEGATIAWLIGLPTATTAY